MAVDGDDVLVGEPILGSRNAHRPLSLNVGKNQDVTPRAVRNSRKPDVFIPASQSNRDRDASHICSSTFLGFDSTVDSQLAFVGLKRLLFLVAIHCIPVIASPSLNQHQQVRCLAVLCIVALGFQLNPDGTMRDELIERLTVVKNSAEKYPHALIVCTGGGTAAENKSATEAGKMAEWLIENGIAAERVIVEDKSLTTAQNAIYTFDILTERYPQVKELVIISSDYHIATGTLLFEAEAILLAEKAGAETVHVVSNAAWKAPSGSLSTMFQAGALIELSGDVNTAFEIYYETYDIHELPPLH